LPPYVLVRHHSSLLLVPFACLHASQQPGPEGESTLKARVQGADPSIPGEESPVVEFYNARAGWMKVGGAAFY